jgi:hypothetical protein
VSPRGTGVDVAEGRPYRIEIAQISFNQFGVRVQVTARTGREIVEYSNPQATLDERINQMRSDESSSTGYESCA